MFALAALALSAPVTYQEVWKINGVPTVVTITRHDSAPAPLPAPVPAGTFVPQPMPSILSPVLTRPVCTTGKCPLR